MTRARSSQLKRITVRMPEQWRGKVTDRRLSAWLRSIPDQLPPDPGGGAFRRSFALSAQSVQHLRQQVRTRRMEPSGFVRSLIASSLGVSRTQTTIAVPAVSQRVAAVVSSFDRKNLGPTSAASGSDLRHADPQGKEGFQKYVAELERIARAGKPNSGEAQVRLARIREQANAKLVDAADYVARRTAV